MKQTEALLKAVEQFKKGDSQAFTTIYEESKAYLATCIRNAVPNITNLEDILQETYIKIAQNIQGLRETTAFNGWARRIAINTAIRSVSRKGEQLAATLDDENGYDVVEENEEFIPEEFIENQTKQKLIQDIIWKELSDTERLCVVGFYYNEMKVKELAEQFNMPENTIKTNLSRARGKIKAAVIDLAENKNTKLYTCTPLLLVLFRNTMAEYADFTFGQKLTDSIQAISKGEVIPEVANTTASSGAESAETAKLPDSTSTAVTAQNGAAASGTAAPAASSAIGATTTAAGSSASALATKVIIGILVAGIGVGGAVATRQVVKKNAQPQETVQDVVKETTAEVEMESETLPEEEVELSELDKAIPITEDYKESKIVLKDYDALRTVLSSLFYVQMTEGNAYTETEILQDPEAQKSFLNQCVNNSSQQTATDLTGWKLDNMGQSTANYDQITQLFSELFGITFSNITWDDCDPDGMYEKGKLAVIDNAICTIDKIYQTDEGQVIIDGVVNCSYKHNYNQDAKEIETYKNDPSLWDGYSRSEVPFRVSCKVNENSAIGYSVEQICAPGLPNIKNLSTDEQDKYGLTTSQEKTMAIIFASLPEEIEDYNEWDVLPIMGMANALGENGDIEGYVQKGEMDYVEWKQFVKNGFSESVLDWNGLQPYFNDDGNGNLEYSGASTESSSLEECQLLIDEWTSIGNDTYKMTGTVLSSEHVYMQVAPGKNKTTFEAKLIKDKESVFGYKITSLELNREEWDYSVDLKLIGVEVQAYKNYLDKNDMALSEYSEGSSFSVDLFDINQDGTLECYWRDISNSSARLYTYDNQKVVEIPLNGRLISGYLPQNKAVCLEYPDGTKESMEFKLESNKIIETDLEVGNNVYIRKIVNNNSEEGYYGGHGSWYEVYCSNLFETVKNTVAEMTDENMAENEATNNGSSKTEVSDAWKDGYRQFIQEKLSENNSEGDGYYFKLFDVNADGMPELYMTTGYLAGGAYICTADENGEVDSVLANNYHLLQYIQGANLILDASTNGDVQPYTIYRVSEGTLETVDEGMNGASSDVFDSSKVTSYDCTLGEMQNLDQIYQAIEVYF